MGEEGSKSVRGATLWLLLRHELRSILRDQKTVVTAVLLPLVLVPALLWISQKTETRREEQEQERVIRYAVDSESGAGADALAQRIERALERWDEDELARTQGGGASQELQPAPKLERVEVEEPRAALDAGELTAYLSDEAGEQGEAQITVHYRGNRETSNSGAATLRRLLERSRIHERERLLSDAGVEVKIRALAQVQREDRASEADSAGLTLGKFLTVVLLMMMLSGGQVVASDIVAGEKERGTLETLLTTAARREEIVLSKLLTIAAVALAITTINIGNLLACVSFGLLPEAQVYASALPPSAVAVLALLFLPLTLQVACLLLLLSSRARSYKEAQLFMVPVQLIMLVPALASLLPKLELRSAIAAVPVANVSVACRELLSGHLDVLALGATVLVNLGVAWWAVRFVARVLEDEQVMAPASGESVEASGGVALFQNHAPRWFAAIWVLVLLSMLTVTNLGVQVVINLVILMFGSSLLMARIYELDLREAFSLRAPPAVAWLAVLIGAPAGLIVTQGVFWLAGFILPVPQEALESFGENFELELPMWQMFLMIALAPAICEELFFRGALLHALRDRMGPVATCVVVGLVFAVFHVSLFRLIPTGFLGVLLAAVTMLTGSIFPAMLWHGIHNGIAIYSTQVEVTPEATPWWVYLGATAVLGLAFALLVWSRRRASEA